MKSTYKMDYISLIKVKICGKVLKSTKMWHHAHCTPFTRAAEKNPSKKAYLPKLAERESRPKHLPPFRKRWWSGLKDQEQGQHWKRGFCVLFVPLWNKTREKRSRSKCTFLWDYSLITDSKLIRTKGPKAKWKYNTIHHHILWRYSLRLLRFVHEWYIGIRKGGCFSSKPFYFSTQKRVHCRTSLKMKACFSPIFAEFSL